MSMKYNNLSRFKKINDFIDYKMARLNGQKESMANLYGLMFSERENVMFEQSEGLIIKKTTYGEAFDAVETKANSLKSLINGAKQSRVGIYMENSAEWIIVFWAILRAGYCPVLLNTRFSDEMLKNVTDDLGVVAVVSDGKRFHIKTLTYADMENGVKLADDEEFGKEFFVLSSGTSSVKACSYTAEELAEIIRNSKHVLKTNKRMKAHYMGELKQLAFLPFYHIFGFVAVYLWFGFFSRTFVKLNDLSPQTIRNTIVKHRVTHIFAVPLFWNTVMNAAKKEIKNRGDGVYEKFKKGLEISDKLGNTPLGRLFADKAFKEVRQNLFGESVKFMITGGSEISSETLKFFNGIGYYLVNGYGMSEIGITSVELSESRKVITSGSVGKPFPSVEYVLSQDGELYVKGASSANAVYSGGREIFRKGGLYKTMDIAANDKDRYKILCRADDLIVSVTGENINPVKTEEVLSSEFAKGVCLINGRNGELPVLIVQADNDGDVKRKAADDIKEKIKANNLVSAIGKIFFTTDDLITGKEFKLSRSRLENDYYSGKLTEWKASAGNAASREDELINKIKEYFSVALNKPADEIDEDADFFLDEGGTSLDYFALIVRLQEDYSVSFPTDGTKSLNTVRQIAEYLRASVNG